MASDGVAIAGIATEVPSGVGTTGMAELVVAVVAEVVVVVAKGSAVEAANVLLSEGNADAEADCAKAVAAGADGNLLCRSNILKRVQSSKYSRGCAQL